MNVSCPEMDLFYLLCARLLLMFNGRATSWRVRIERDECWGLPSFLCNMSLLWSAHDSFHSSTVSVHWFHVQYLGHKIGVKGRPHTGSSCI